MSLVLVTAPTALPVTRDQAKAHLRIDHNDDDDYIDALIATATESLDGETGTLGRALMPQQYDWKFRHFEDYNKIPLPPLISLDLITYIDLNQQLQTLDPSIYQVVGLGTKWPGYFRHAYGKYWFPTLNIPEAVTVRFTCGYATTDNDKTFAVPKAIKQAILLIVSNLYENRNPVIAESGRVQVIELPKSTDALLAPYVVHDFK